MQTFINATAIVRVTRDPEVREFGTTKVAKFGGAANYKRKGKDGNTEEAPVFIDIKAFGQNADFVAQYVKKSDPVAVVGRVEMNTWIAKDGSKGVAFVIIADRVIALSGKDDQPQRPAAQTPRQRPVETKGQQPERDDEVRGEDIPF